MPILTELKRGLANQHPPKPVQPRRLAAAGRLAAQIVDDVSQEQDLLRGAYPRAGSPQTERIREKEASWLAQLKKPPSPAPEVSGDPRFSTPVLACRDVVGASSVPSLGLSSFETELASKQARLVDELVSAKLSDALQYASAQMEAKMNEVLSRTMSVFETRLDASLSETSALQQRLQAQAGEVDAGLAQLRAARLPPRSRSSEVRESEVNAELASKIGELEKGFAELRSAVASMQWADDGPSAQRSVLFSPERTASGLEPLQAAGVPAAEALQDMKVRVEAESKLRKRLVSQLDATLLEVTDLRASAAAHREDHLALAQTVQAQAKLINQAAAGRLATRSHETLRDEHAELCMQVESLATKLGDHAESSQRMQAVMSEEHRRNIAGIDVKVQQAVVQHAQVQQQTIGTTNPFDDKTVSEEFQQHHRAAVDRLQSDALALREEHQTSMSNIHREAVQRLQAEADALTQERQAAAALAGASHREVLERIHADAQQAVQQQQEATACMHQELNTRHETMDVEISSRCDGLQQVLRTHFRDMAKLCEDERCARLGVEQQVEEVKNTLAEAKVMANPSHLKAISDERAAREALAEQVEIARRTLADLQDCVYGQSDPQEQDGSRSKSAATPMPLPADHNEFLARELALERKTRVDECERLDGEIAAVSQAIRRFKLAQKAENGAPVSQEAQATDVNVEQLMKMIEVDRQARIDFIKALEQEREAQASAVDADLKCRAHEVKEQKEELLGLIEAERTARLTFQRSMTAKDDNGTRQDSSADIVDLRTLSNGHTRKLDELFKAMDALSRPSAVSQEAVCSYLPFQINGVTVLQHEGSNRYRYDSRGLGNRYPLAYRNSKDLEDYHSTTVLNLGEAVGGTVEKTEGGIKWLKVDQASGRSQAAVAASGRTRSSAVVQRSLDETEAAIAPDALVVSEAASPQKQKQVLLAEFVRRVMEESGIRYMQPAKPTMFSRQPTPQTDDTDQTPAASSATASPVVDLKSMRSDVSSVDSLRVELVRAALRSIPSSPLAPRCEELG